MNHRRLDQAVRRVTRCGCGRFTSHAGMCAARVARKRAEGWALPSKRGAKAESPLESCLRALETVHEACIAFAFAYHQLRRGRITEARLIEAGGPE